MTVQWLESFVLAEAAGAFALASMNCRRLLAYARASRAAARRVGAGAMCAVSAALAMEALAHLAAPALASSPPARDLAVLAVRSGLLLASAVITALLLRGGRRRWE